MRKIIISGFNIKDNNRGTAALSYGSVVFLKKYHNLNTDVKIINLRFVKNIFRRNNLNNYEEKININNDFYTIETINILWLEKTLYLKYGLLLPFSKLKRIIKEIEYVAAINGGDGFSDIYNSNTFYNRLPDTLIALKAGIPLIILPQTLGPFTNSKNLAIAKKILKRAQTVYVRDECFNDELNKLNVKYEISNDLSAFMVPQYIDFDILPYSIGLNISGLAYSNNFQSLSNQFSNYHYLCQKIVECFQKINRTIYLISHSYNYNNPEEGNDDLLAAKQFYESLSNKNNIILIDRDLNSPETKYVISKMSFFIGTRMHANYAAIFSKVPLFGLSYSYKFKGAFERNNIYDQTAMINNISREEADKIVEKIYQVYLKYNN